MALYLGFFRNFSVCFYMVDTKVFKIQPKCNYTFLVKKVLRCWVTFAWVQVDLIFRISGTAGYPRLHPSLVSS